MALIFLGGMFATFLLLATYIVSRLTLGGC